MNLKKHSWIFSLLALIIVLTLIANVDKIFGFDLSSKAAYNFTNNPNGIVVEEFSDFACPFCSQIRPELHRTLNKYSGDINFLFRHLIVHPETQLAAEASECARDQGRFMEFTDLIFNNQDFSDKSLVQYAENINLDMTQFENCFLSHEKAAVVERDYQDAMNRNVLGTPAFFVDGQQVSIENLDYAIGVALNDSS